MRSVRSADGACSRHVEIVADETGNPDESGVGHRLQARRFPPLVEGEVLHGLTGDGGPFESLVFGLPQEAVADEATHDDLQHGHRDDRSRHEGHEETQGEPLPHSGKQRAQG